MQRKLLLVLLTLQIATKTNAQIFKPQVKVAPSPLDKIKISNRFSATPLDEVYNTLSSQYGLKIVYDTFNCAAIPFTYWYMTTPATLAIEITTRDNDLKYYIDSSSLTIHVKALHPNKLRKEIKRTILPTEKVTAVTEVHHSIPIEGILVDDSTDERIENISITVLGTDIQTNTKNDGSFYIENIPNDTTTLLIKGAGYLDETIFLNPQLVKSKLIIGLTPAAHTLNEAVVTAHKQEVMSLSSSTISTIKLSPQKLSEIPNVGEKDIMRSFQLMPGISASNESSSGLYVRGGTPDQNLVMYDGFTVYQVDHLYGFFSAFNANAVKEVELNKGGFEAKYGGRLSSVTNLTGKEGSPTKFNIGGDLSLLSANIYTEVPITEKLSLVAAGRHSWQGPIYNWIFDKFNKTGSTASNNEGGPGGMSDNTTKAKSYFYDINARLTYKLNKKDELIYSFFNGYDNLNNSYSIDAPPFLAQSGISFNLGTTDKTNYTNTGMSWIYKKAIGNKISTETTLSYSNFRSDRNRINTGQFRRSSTDSSDVNTGVFEKNNLKDLTAKTDIYYCPTKLLSISGGGFATNYDIKYSYSQTDTSLLVNKKDVSSLLGTYLQAKLSAFGRRLEITPGIRYSFYGLTNKFYTEPRLSASYKITENISYKAATGLYYQFANRITREDISTGSSQFWVLADGKDVPVSSSIHYISGLSYENNSLLVSVEGYYKTLNDLSQFTERYTANTSSIDYVPSFYHGTGYSKGVEFLVQKKAGSFTGWVSYTLAKTMYNFPVYGTNDFPADQDTRHEIKIVGMYKLKKRWDFAATWVYASGKPYTAPGGGYELTLLDGSTKSYVTATEKNTLRLPDYHRMDLSVNYHFWNEEKKDIGYIGLSIFNVYARNNVWYKQYTVLDGTVTETNVNYLSFTPNITLSLKLR